MKKIMIIGEFEIQEDDKRAVIDGGSIVTTGEGDKVDQDELAQCLLSMNYIISCKYLGMGGLTGTNRISATLFSGDKSAKEKAAVLWNQRPASTKEKEK